MVKSIGEYKKDYEAARARGDAAGMQAANDGANAVRVSLGLAKQSASADIAKFQTPTKTTTTTSKGSSGSSRSSGSFGSSSGHNYLPGTPTSTQTARTPQEVLAQGKGPLNVPLSGGTATKQPQPTQQPQKQVSVTDSPEYKSLLGELDSLRGQVQQSKSDYSDYVRQLQKAAKEKSLSELEAAYQKNVNAIDAAKGQIAPKYTDARNQVAGQAAVSRKNWQETASALGVNSGAAGQSDIAQNLAMQNNLAALDKSETADMAALDLQRTQATTDYNSAIAKAEADGDYELAAALYQEKVRADETARADQATRFQQMLQQLQFEYGMGQDALAQENLERSRQDTLAQQGWNNRFQEEQAEAAKQTQNFNNLLTLVSSFAESTGDYSLFNQFGFTQDQIAAWNSAWAQQHALELQQAYAKLAGGSKTSGGGKAMSVGGSTAYTDPYEAMREAGIYDAAGAYAWALNNGNSSTEAAKLAEFFGTRQPVTDEAQLGETARLIAGMAKRVTNDSQLAVIAKQIESTLASGGITTGEAEYLTRMLGY